MCNWFTFWIIVHVICQCKINITISANKHHRLRGKTEVEMAAYDFQMAHYHSLCISLDYYMAAHVVYMCVYPAIWIYIQLPTTTIDCIKESLTSRNQVTYWRHKRHLVTSPFSQNSASKLSGPKGWYNENFKPKIIGGYTQKGK